MPRLKKACYCLSLRTGTLMIGWLSLVASSVFISVATYLIKPITDEPAQYSDEWLGKAYYATILLLICVVMGLDILSVAALLYGVYRERRSFLVPYLLMNGIMLLGVIGIFALSVKKQESMLYLSYWIAFAVGLVYFLVVVWSYSSEIKAQRNHADVVYTTTNSADRKNLNNAEEDLME